MITDVEKTIREYLPNVIHMSLATSKSGQPWVCEVHFSYDDALNLYFRSKPSTRHGQEIAANPRVAGNIVEPHGLTDKPRGVYFEGTAELLKAVDEQHPAYLTNFQRFNFDGILEDAKDPTGHQFYKITVSKFYLFDSRDSRPNQKYELEWKKAI